MAAGNTPRLSKVAREFNVGLSTIIDFLHKKGHKIETSPNTKISQEQYALLIEEFSSDISLKKESEKLNLKSVRDKSKETVTLNDIDEENSDEPEGEDEVLVKNTGVADKRDEIIRKPKQESNIKILGKIDLEEGKKKKPVEAPKKEKIEEPEVKEEKPIEKVEEKKVVKEEKPLETKEKKEQKEEQKEEKKKEQKEEKKEEIKQAPDQPDPEPEVSEPERIESKRLTELKKRTEDGDYEVKVLGKIDLASMNQKTRPARKTKEEKDKERQAKKESQKSQQASGNNAVEDGKGSSKNKDKVIRAEAKKLSGPRVLGKMELANDKNKSDSSDNDNRDKKKRRKRIRKDKEPVGVVKSNSGGDARSKDNNFKKGKKKNTRHFRQEVSEEDVEKQIKDTLARLTSKGKSKGAKYRREKRDANYQKEQEQAEQKELTRNVLKVTEFVSVNELATMMNVPPTQVISTCMSLGLFVSINQRLDAETMALVADEFNYKVEFISVEVQEAIKLEEDKEEDIVARSPIVTVMGHVDHGKTKLLDYVRNANVIAGEAGGITQHIGAYAVNLEDGRKITFLDTPGHEAFTAMRARGAQITDVAIIVVAADDGVMPQTVEAINHAHAAGVPIVFAINKIDKPTANAEKIKEELANMNFLVEDWGGKYQSQEISAKNGINIDELLEKVLLEAELLDLKANPNKRALGTVIESSLDKGRGYTTTILVEAGTLKIGDILLAGHYTGHVKAMFNERGKIIEEAGPATPVVILGLNGAPQAGDKFNVMENDREAKEIATKREQLQREQGLRTQKHITLDEIGRRIAIGNFQELNVIVKGDVDGSVEALSDSLIKLSTEEIQVNIKHKAVGQISEADILLAAASDAIIIGFQVRPSINARRLAEKEEIDVRLYSIIYDAIGDLKSAMEGMLSPEIKEEITGSAEIQETFKITKVGTIAGCMVREGKIYRTSNIRVIRDGIVVYTGVLGSLKRFKDDAKEVVSGLECGLNIEGYNDIKVGDIVEAYKETEVKKKL